MLEDASFPPPPPYVVSILVGFPTNMCYITIILATELITAWTELELSSLPDDHPTKTNE